MTHAADARASRSPERGGFVLVLVVMMLFAISVASATGYIVVNDEFDMARHSDEGAEALSVAQAGLHRFVAEQLGVVGNNVSYATGTGTALINTRKLGIIDADTDLYYIRSQGTVSNIFTPTSPARRVVGAYAYHHRRPLPNLGALVVTSASAGAGSNGVNGIVTGNDQNNNSDCPVASGPGPNIAGAIARSSTVSSGTLQGSPPGSSGGAYNSYSNIYNAIGLRWDVLTHPSFPVDFVNVEPNWATIPSDSFPVIRVTNTPFTGAGWNGRGVLIVTGEFDATSSFYWNGIVLAGAMDDIHEGHVNGLVVGGLNAQNVKSPVIFESGGYVRYYSCTVWDANESLSFMELLPDTEWEIS
ncbi:MAG: hypothetical protein AB7T31_03605 [Gemmatimonadales bacterium]